MSHVNRVACVPPVIDLLPDPILTTQTGFHSVKYIYEARKPVKTRHGRATVIGSRALGMRIESQTLLCSMCISRPGRVIPRRRINGRHRS